MVPVLDVHVVDSRSQWKMFLFAGLFLGGFGLGFNIHPELGARSARVEGYNNLPGQLPRLNGVVDLTHDGDDDDGSARDRAGFRVFSQPITPDQVD
jgi:hypothetical protein